MDLKHLVFVKFSINDAPADANGMYQVTICNHENVVGFVHKDEFTKHEFTKDEFTKKEKEIVFWFTGRVYMINLGNVVLTRNCDMHFRCAIMSCFQPTVYKYLETHDDTDIKRIIASIELRIAIDEQEGCTLLRHYTEQVLYLQNVLDSV